MSAKASCQSTVSGIKAQTTYTGTLIKPATLTADVLAQLCIGGMLFATFWLTG